MNNEAMIVNVRNKAARVVRRATMSCRGISRGRVTSWRPSERQGGHDHGAWKSVETGGDDCTGPTVDRLLIIFAEAHQYFTIRAWTSSARDNSDRRGIAIRWS